MQLTANCGDYYEFMIL